MMMLKTDVAKAYDVSVETLSSAITDEQLAEAKAIGGHPSDKWLPGACWAEEGQYLYRTVREMQPDVIVEVGRFEGCSTTHLALGCKHNGKGRVYSIDINAGAGSKIPADLRPYVEFINRDIFTFDWQKEYGMPIDLLLEDGNHSPGFTKHVLRNFKARRVIVHDYAHVLCEPVKKECNEVLGPPDLVYQPGESDCGYAVYKFDERN